MRRRAPVRHVAIGRRVQRVDRRNEGGKSLLIGALALLAGGRVAKPKSAGKSTAAAEIEAVFSLAGCDAAWQWLRAHNLADADDKDILLARRVLGGGGGRARGVSSGRRRDCGDMGRTDGLLDSGRRTLRMARRNTHQTSTQGAGRVKRTAAGYSRSR